MQTLDRKLLTVIDRLTESARASKIVALNAALLADQIQNGRAQNTHAIKVVAGEIQRLSDESSTGIAALHAILDEVKLLTQTINLAGRQRMLSQRLMKLVLIQRERQAPERAQEIERLTGDFERTLDRLKGCNLNTSAIHAQLERVVATWAAFKSVLRDNDISQAVVLNERVLQEMHAAVQYYEELAGTRAA